VPRGRVIYEEKKLDLKKRGKIWDLFSLIKVKVRLKR
jgi:hypothetical protein